jgi:CheY-like chemotaxis protein
MNANGTGLGLALCHALAKQLGGQLDFTSTLAVGSCFWFTIEAPVMKGDIEYRDREMNEGVGGVGGAERKCISGAVDGHVQLVGGTGNTTSKIITKIATSVTPAHGLEKLFCDESMPRVRLLVVDDERAILKVTELLFQGTNVRIAEAMNGLEAITLVRCEDFDCIVMDCNMPIMNGFECAREIRSLERARGGTRRTPIIGHTANAEPNYVAACIDAGMDLVVPKAGTKAASALVEEVMRLSGMRIAGKKQR